MANELEMNKFFGAKQRGGTLLGFILGTLLGLGAALAVAVYVTKVPILFSNKSQPHNAEDDAAETKKNKDWNPNAPLAGKNPPRPNVAPSGAEGTTVAPMVSGTVAPEIAAPAPAPSPVPVLIPAPAKAKVSADPLGDLAKSKIQSKPDVVSSGPGADPFSYFIQVGAFRTPEDAEQQRAKLSLMGFQAKVSEREQSGRTVYRVRLGPFDKKDDADKAKEKLDGNAIETALVRVQR